MLVDVSHQSFCDDFNIRGLSHSTLVFMNDDDVASAVNLSVIARLHMVSRRTLCVDFVDNLGLTNCRTWQTALKQSLALALFKIRNAC